MSAINQAWMSGEQGKLAAQAMAQEDVRNFLSNQGLDLAQYSSYIPQVRVQVNADGVPVVTVPDALNEILHDLGRKDIAVNPEMIEDPGDTWLADERAARLTQLKMHAYQHMGIEPHTFNADKSNIFITRPIEGKDLADLAKRLYGALPPVRPTQLALARLDMGLEKFGVDDRTAMGLLDMRKKLLSQIGESATRIRGTLRSIQATNPTDTMAFGKANAGLVDLVMFRRQTLMLQAYEETLISGSVQPETLKRLKEVELVVGPGFDKSLDTAINNVAPGAMSLPAMPEELPNEIVNNSMGEARKLQLEQALKFIEIDKHFIETLSDVQDKPQAVANALKLYNKAIMADMAENAKQRSAKWAQRERMERPIGESGAVQNITDQVSPEEKAQMVMRATGKKPQPLQEKVLGKEAKNPEFDRANVKPELDLEKAKAFRQAREETKALRTQYKDERTKAAAQAEIERIMDAKERIRKAALPVNTKPTPEQAHERLVRLWSEIDTHAEHFYAFLDEVEQRTKDAAEAAKINKRKDTIKQLMTKRQAKIKDMRNMAAAEQEADETLDWLMSIY